MTTWRDATQLEREAMVALSRCRFAVASPPKRFARSMRSQVDAAEHSQWSLPQITDPQAKLLWFYCHRFRRQIASARVRQEAEEQRNINHAAQDTPS